jgi:simple sugar transport system ATP-binding protein
VGKVGRVLLPYLKKGVCLLCRDTILKLTSISKSFAGVLALDNVDMEIRKGGIHCLIGENGSGKSTLVKIISGVHKPDSGGIEIDGEKYSCMTPMESVEKGVQIIYQDFSLFPNLQVYENIALNNELYEKNKFINKKKMRARAKEALENIEVSIDLDERVENLSVANKQLVAIARALLHNARLIIMDEPTTALTKKEVASLFRIIKKLQAQGVSILFISHKLDEVFEISQDFTILRNGKKIKDGETAEFDADKFIYYMTGRNIEEKLFCPKEQADGSEPLFEVKGLSLKNGFRDIALR